VSERVSYPIELNLAGSEVVVIGGGPVAARKVEGLVRAGAKVRAVSMGFVPELLQRTDIHRQTEPYTPQAIGSAKLVFACTDDRQTNAQIAADARAAGCWCNVADDPEAGDFFVPAVLRRGQFTVAVGTGGAGPHLAASLRDGLESQFGAEFGILVEELQRARKIVRDQIGDPEVRRRLFATLCSPESVEVLRSAGIPGWREWFEKLTCQIVRSA
jgi:precorrin-2 dehydrogenase / sirohydrochlorin ferrochelatase